MTEAEMTEKEQRAMERKLLRQQEAEARARGETLKNEKRIPLDQVYGGLKAITEALDAEAGILTYDLWYTERGRYVRIHKASKIELLPADAPTVLVVDGDTAKNALVKKEQGRVFSSSGTWIDSEAADIERERMKRANELQAKAQLAWEAENAHADPASELCSKLESVNISAS